MFFCEFEADASSLCVLQDLAAMRAQMSSSSVNVELDSAPQQDLSEVMDEIRAQYEGIVEKNRLQMETWYKGQVQDIGLIVH